LQDWLLTAYVQFLEHINIDIVCFPVSPNIVNRKVFMWCKGSSEDCPCYRAVFDFVQGMIPPEGY